MSKLLQFLDSPKLAVALLAIACFAAYMPFLNAPAHLDDQFLISWLTHLKGLEGSQFMNWAGPDKLDAWGPAMHFWFIAKALFIKKSIWLWRLAGLGIHLLTSIFVYLIVRRLSSDNKALIAISAALLFAVYPLHPEAVFWISGKASELSAFFILSSIYCFLRGKQSKAWLVGGLLLIALALSTQFTFGVSNQVFNFQKWYQLLRNLFFPINNEIVPKYPREYRFMYFLLVPALVALPIAFWKSRRFAYQAAIVLAILIITCLPYVGIACDTRNLYGSRFLYLATFPVCLLLTYIFTSFTQITNKLKPLTTIASGIFLVLLFIFFFRMTWQQNSAYRAATHVLNSIQKSVAVVVAKEGSPYVFIRDLPRSSSVVPAPVEYSIVALHGQTGLLSAWVVPAERLKRELGKSNNVACSLRWDKDFLALVAFDLTPNKNGLLELDGAGIVARMMPGLIFYRTASYDAENKYLILDSNSTVSGPAVRLAGDGLSPIDSQMFYIDARINAPSVAANQEVELYWTTRLYDDYNHHDRRSFTHALVNDGQFHRYYLPLSCAGYYANGTIAAITLGFPAGSKVWLARMGVTSDEKLTAQLSLEATSIVPASSAYASPYYQYPQIAELGLCQLADNQELALDYSVANIEGAVSALMEIAEPNQFFKNPNGNSLSAACSKQIPLTGMSGKCRLKTTDFKGPAVYSVRLIGIGANGQPVGNFSDSINCLVR